jgi:hypothetical protein
MQEDDFVFWVGVWVSGGRKEKEPFCHILGFDVLTSNPMILSPTNNFFLKKTQFQSLEA